MESLLNFSEEKEDFDEEMKINPKEEKIFCNKIVISLILYPLSLCPKCQKKIFNIHESQNDDIINPSYLRYVIKSCKYMRNIR